MYAKLDKQEPNHKILIEDVFQGTCEITVKKVKSQGRIKCIKSY